MIQQEMAGLVSIEDDIGDVRLVAGVDVSVPRPGLIARGAVIVLNYPDMAPVESQIVEMAIDFPYVPGLLSFRELPVLLAAFEKLWNMPDLILVDGQGIAHPRKCGLASHLGILVDTPAIGCAKSRLCGKHDPVETEAGSLSELTDNGAIIGAVLRTRSNVKPLYISTGHKVSLRTAVKWVLDCCRGYRIPEPTRQAHLAAKEKTTFGEINGRAEETT